MKNLDDDFDAFLITGPTASGKSAFALKLARAHNAVVINADSMQVYDTLEVLSARPSVADMEGIEHHLYGHVAATSLYSTGEWLRDIEALLADLKSQGKLPIIIGGTGLYFKALTGGLSEMPSIPPVIRDSYRQRLIEEGSEALHNELKLRDAITAESLKLQDGQRVVRALEILEATGQSIREFQSRTGPMLVDPAKAKKFVILPERSLLHQRINSRFEKMMDMGAVEEVKAILALNLPADSTAMKAIGISQISEMLLGHITKAQAIELSSAATRQYAKRQMTWFRNQMGEDWERIAP